MAYDHDMVKVMYKHITPYKSTYIITLIMEIIIILFTTGIILVTIVTDIYLMHHSGISDRYL
jgi:hypothetical protein